MSWRVLLADGRAETGRWVARWLPEGCALETATTAEAALAALAARPAQALLVGDELPDAAPDELVERAADAAAGRGERLPIVQIDGPLPDAGHAARLYHRVSRVLPAAALTELLSCALGRRPPRAPPQLALHGPAEATMAQRVFDEARRIAQQRDLGSAAEAVIRALHDLLDADRAYCLFHDTDSGALWSETEGDRREHHAVCGLAGYAARTGRTVGAPRADADPCFAAAIDDPPGDGRQRVVAQPVLGDDAQIHAVLLAVRESTRPDFSELDFQLLGFFAGRIGPMFAQLSLELEASALLEEAGDGQLFRREAVQAHAALGRHGDVVRVSPTWVGWTYWLVLAALVAGGLYLVLGRIGEYSTGPAVVRRAGRSELTAQVAGNVTAVEVTPGQRVRAGQLLVRLYDAEQAAELARLEREFETQLRSRLLAPGDLAAEQAVRGLRGHIESARSHLEERSVRAPRHGLVGDVRVRPGQFLSPGETILSLLDEGGVAHVVALLPGGDRPRLRPGMAMRLELTGYRYAYQNLVLDSVAEEVIGPAEARRYLGNQVADALPIDGPVTVVRAQLPGSSFTVDGETFFYHDGMPATAEVRLRSESILLTLVPALRRL